MSPFVSLVDASLFQANSPNNILSLNFDETKLEKWTIPRSDWIKERPENKLIWLGGGGSYVLEQRYVPLVKRDLQAPSNPGKLTIPTGLADTAEELLNPMLLIRELFEEVFLENIKGEVFYPHLSDQDSLEIMHKLFPYKKYTSTRASINRSFDKDQIKTIKNKQEQVSTGLLCVDKARGFVNFLKRVDLPDVKFEDIYHAYDTEKDHRGELLKREISFYDILNEEVICWETKSKRPYDASEFTFHADYFIQRIKQSQEKL